MAISLIKGQKISLKKDDGSCLVDFCVGANWGAISKTGLFGNTKIVPVDLDLSLACFDSNKNLKNVVYFGNKSASGIVHSGDDLTGDVDGDDGLDNEIISIDLGRVDSNVDQIIFVLNSYNQIDFNDIPFASIRLYEGTPTRVNKVFATYNVARDHTFAYKVAMILGKLYKHNGEWKFSAIGEPTADKKLEELIGRSVIKYKVLYFGILGAIVFRLIFVAIGSGLFMLGSWMQIIFGLVVLYSAILMLKTNDSDDDEIEDYSNHLAYKFVYKYFSVFPKIVGHSFFISKNTAQSELNKNPNLNFLNKKTWLIATPLFLCLCVIEVSDVMFAFDSVPAVIAVSQEPLIIYSAMIFAILGLRAIYFVLESLKKYLVYLEKSVIVLLFFIGFKIIINALNAMFDLEFEISSTISLIAIFTILGFGVLASVFVGKKQDISNL